MSSQEDRARRRKRFHNRVAKDLRTPKYRQRVEEDKKKHVDVTKLSHADLVKMINEDKDGDA